MAATRAWFCRAFYIGTDFGLARAWPALGIGHRLDASQRAAPIFSTNGGLISHINSIAILGWTALPYIALLIPIISGIFPSSSYFSTSRLSLAVLFRLRAFVLRRPLGYGPLVI